MGTSRSGSAAGVRMVTPKLFLNPCLHTPPTQTHAQDQEEDADMRQRMNIFKDRGSRDQRQGHCLSVSTSARATAGSCLR